MSNVVAFPDREKKQAEIVLPQIDPSHAYAELAVTSNFSFLRGASHPEDLVRQAAALGLTGIGIADRNSVAGVVRAWSAAEQLNEKIRELNEETKAEHPELKLAVGARRKMRAISCGAFRCRSALASSSRPAVSMVTCSRMQVITSCKARRSGT